MNESEERMEETKEVVINNKRYHFEVELDEGKNVSCVHLTECGRNPDAIEMLKTYDLYPKE